MKASRIEYLVLVCHGKDCRKKGADDLRTVARHAARELGVKRTCLVAKSKCLGQCKRAPIVCLQPANDWVERASAKAVRQAMERIVAG